MKGNANIIYIICCIVLVLTVQISCKNNKSSVDENSTVDKPAREIKLVEVPSMMTDPESRSKYASEHYWDDFDFNDSTYLGNRKAMNDHMGIYFFVLANTTQDAIDKPISSFVSKFFRGNATLRSYFLDAIESALYDPNSEIRNEALYIAFLKSFVGSGDVDFSLKEKYTFQLELALKNRPGAMALDFKYIDRDNRVSSLRKTNGKYILLFFYEPGCPSCKSTKQGIKESAVFKEIGSNLTYLAIYTGEDYNEWKEDLGSFPSEWIVAHDIGQELVNDKLYDLRASPTMYLLDSTHKVLLKDPDLFQLNNYLSTLL